MLHCTENYPHRLNRRRAGGEWKWLDEGDSLDRIGSYVEYQTATWQNKTHGLSNTLNKCSSRAGHSFIVFNVDHDNISLVPVLTLCSLGLNHL